MTNTEHSVWVSRCVETGEWLVRTKCGSFMDNFLMKHQGTIINRIVCHVIIVIGQLTGRYTWVTNVTPLDAD